VLAVVTDRKLVHCSGEELMCFEAQVVSVTDYYPFGMEIKERSWSVSSYRYGFNGQEKDDEVSGAGNSYTAEYWQYDSRLGRRWNVDPVYVHSKSNYCAFSNRPVIMIDPNGNSDYYAPNGTYLGSDGTNGTDIIIVTDKKVRSQMVKGNEFNLNKGIYTVYDKPLEEGTYFVLPPENQREQIEKIMETFDPDVNKEVGGRGLLFWR
jgi:RHS repeat-associated protein